MGERMSGGLTGLFYHPSFSRRSYLTTGRRLAHFPGALAPLLRHSHIALFECPMATDELILLAHDPALIPLVEADPLWSTARASVGGVVEGMIRIARGELRNGFCFIGAGGHHAGRDFFGGYCCFNDVVIAMTHVRQTTALRRFAILDTDAHHGDGTRDLIQDDPAVLHLCVCGMRYESADGTKVDFPFPDPVGGETMDQAYLALLDREIPHRIADFHPDLLIWYFGFDTHRGDYGDIGLSCPAYLDTADRMLALAKGHSSGRLLVVLGGGSRTDLATQLIPPIIARLAGVVPE